LLESARRIASKEIDVEAWVGPQNVFEILGNGNNAGSCGNCAGH
jgi:hypothetical protein